MSSTTKHSLAAYGHSLLRIIIGFLFSCHGAQKLLGFFGGMGGAGAKAVFPSIFWAAGFLELVGGLLIFFGLFTRITAFILSGEMAVAYFTVHFQRGFWPIKNGGEPAVLYCFLFLYHRGCGGWTIESGSRYMGEIRRGKRVVLNFPQLRRPNAKTIGCLVSGTAVPCLYKEKSRSVSLFS